MKMIIPSKIKRRTMKKVLIRVSIFVIILILLVSAFIFLKPLAALERNNKILTFYIGVFLDIAVTGVPFKLIRRSWQGEVLGVKIKTSTETWNPSKPTASSWYTANTVILTLKTPKNNIIMETAETANARNTQADIDRYKRGDYVAQINGTEYPAHYKLESNETRCVICGSYASNDLHECEQCGNPLVTFTK